MSKFRRLLWSAVAMATRYDRYAYYDRNLLERCYDAERLEEARCEKLHALVAHAAETVPYYRDLFREHRIDPRDIHSPEDLSSVPVLTKELLRENFERLFSTRFDRRSLSITTTGGSTGSPTHYAHDRRYTEISQAALMRSWSWSDWRPFDLIAWVGGNDATPSLRTHAEAAVKRIVSGKLILNAFDASDEHLLAWCDAIRRHRPTLYYGYASALTLLGRFAADRGIELPRAHAAVTTAEKLYPEQTEAIERGLGCPVRDFYGCREVMNIAATCGRGRMHQIADMTVLSTADAGSVIVTPLDSYGMPLLRYANGDVVEMTADRCECGLSLPVVQMRVGRTTDFFVNRNGRRIHGEFFTHMMYGVRGVREFQFHQKAVDDVILRVVLDGHRSAEDMKKEFERIRSEVERRCGLPLRCEIVATIDRTRAGKHLFTVSDVGSR